MIAVHRLVAGYFRRPVLQNLNLDVGEGEFVLIAGPNGHGKSTLMKVLAGLLSPTSGRISIGGQDVTGLGPPEILARGLAYVPETLNLFPDMTVRENLLLGAYLENSRRRRGDRLKKVYELFPRLVERRSALAGNLSGGEARMLAIGRGLMSGAPCLAIDEPSVGLAPRLRSEVFQALGRINRSGVTVLLVEQNILEAAAVATRIYVIENGRIMVEGRAADVLADRKLLSVYLGVEVEELTAHALS